MNEMEDKVFKIIEELLGKSRDEIKLNSDFVDDLNADSLDTLELVMTFEEEFDISISDEDVENMITVQSAIDFIKRLQCREK